MNFNPEAITAETRQNFYAMHTFRNLLILIKRSVLGTKINNAVYFLGIFHQLYPDLRRQPLQLLELTTEVFAFC